MNATTRKAQMWGKLNNLSCPLCGEIMTFDSCNIDHIIPKSLGGSNRKANLQLAHIKCNAKKGNNYCFKPTDEPIKRKEKHPPYTLKRLQSILADITRQRYGGI